MSSENALLPRVWELERSLATAVRANESLRQQLAAAQAENLRLAGEVANRNGRAIDGDKAVVELNKALDRLDIAEGNHAGLVNQLADSQKQVVILRQELLHYGEHEGSCSIVDLGADPTSSANTIPHNVSD